jgi:hypothetical protein
MKAVYFHHRFSLWLAGATAGSSNRLLDAGSAPITSPFARHPIDIKDRSETFRRCDAITELHDILHFMPIDHVAIKPQPKPTSRPNISRQIKALRVTTDAIHIFAEGSLAAYRDDSITVMAIQIVREYLTAHSKVRVITPNAPLAFGQRETNLAKSGKPWRFGVFNHCENLSRRPTMRLRNMQERETKPPYPDHRFCPLANRSYGRSLQPIVMRTNQFLSPISGPDTLNFIGKIIRQIDGGAVKRSSFANFID